MERKKILFEDLEFDYYYQKINDKCCDDFDVSLLLKEYFDTKNIDIRNKIIEKNLKLVVYVAKEYVNCGLPLIDLVQEGNIGLISSIDKYDINKGYKFSTYAVYWIRQAIVRALENKSNIIRVPSHIYQKLNKLKVFLYDFSLINGRYPVYSEVADYLSISEDEARFLCSVNYDHIYFSSPIVSFDDGDEISFQDNLPDEFNLEDHVCGDDNLEKLKSSLSVLTFREFDILVKRFGLFGENKLSLKELGEIYGISDERVRQINEESLIKVRKKVRSL